MSLRMVQIPPLPIGSISMNSPVNYKEGEDFEDAYDITYDVFAFTPHMPKLNIRESGCSRLSPENCSLLDRRI